MSTFLNTTIIPIRPPGHRNLSVSSLKPVLTAAGKASRRSWWPQRLTLAAKYSASNAQLYAPSAPQNTFEAHETDSRSKAVGSNPTGASAKALPWRRAYDLAKSNGFKGTWYQWKLEFAPWVLSRRKSDALPCISSLVRLKQPKGEDFPLFAFRNRPKGLYIDRRVLLNGTPLGVINLTVPHLPTLDIRRDSIPLRPYFDPTKQELRFQQPDGSDYPHAKSLRSMAGCPRLRFLLQVAHAEGLLGKVPEGCLTSLKFETLLSSGFAVDAPITARSNPKCNAGIRLHPRSRGNRIIKTRISPVVPSDVTRLLYFPYVAEDGKMRFWDIDKGENITMRRNGGGKRDSFTQDEVKTRWPALYNVGKREGLWTGGPVRPVDEHKMDTMS